MKPFFLLLGLTLSLGIGRWADIPFSVTLILLAFPSGLLAHRKGYFSFFVIGVLLGLGFHLISMLPWPRGNLFLITHKGNGYVFVSSWFRSYYLEDKSHNLEIGDIVKIDASFYPYKANTFESRFSFPSYLESYGIKEEVEGRLNYVMKVPIRFGKLEDAFLGKFDTKTSQILGKILFSRGGSIEELNKADDLRILFYLSAGGFLLSFLLRGLEKALGYFFKERIAKIIVFVFSLIFLPLGLRKIGIVRVILMRGLGVAFYKKKLERIAILSIAGLIILGLNPYNVFQSGFLLGFGLSFLFYFISPTLSQLKGYKQKGASLLCLRLFLLPMDISSCAYHPFSFIFGFILLPISILTMGLGYLSFASFPFVNLLSGLSSAIAFLINLFSRIDVRIFLPALSAVGITLFIIFYILYFYFQELGMKRLRRMIALAAPSLYLVSLIPFGYLFTSEVVFVNVGQGDCILLRERNYVAMVDTGGNIGFDMAEESLIPFLLKRRIYHIDALISSHGDFDHVGAVSSLCAKFRVGRYITERKDFPLKVGRMTFVNYNIYEGQEENDKSLVLTTKVGGKTFLLTGDAPYQIEKQIIRDHPELRCDILKLGHHGSNTSSCEEFLVTVKPSVAIISCGARNKYGHPTKEIIDRLNKLKIPYRRTDEEGSISYKGWG